MAGASVAVVELLLSQMSSPSRFGLLLVKGVQLPTYDGFQIGLVLATFTLTRIRRDEDVQMQWL